MTARQQRRLLYETAFDSRVKRDADDLDGLMVVQQRQSGPLFLGRAAAPQQANDSETVARAASRSSFGSTSGSSASSTPTHQPMEIARHSPHRLHPFTPTERRKVTLVRDGPLVSHRSMSPQARPLRGTVVNQNFERKISFNNSGGGGQWDSVSRCSDKSSSQESMNVELSGGRNCSVLGRSASRDSLNQFLRDDRSNNLTSNYPNNWKELTSAKLEHSNATNELQKDPAPKKSVGHHPGVKVLPAEGSPRFSSRTRSSRSCDPLTTAHPPPSQDPELKENHSQTSTDAVTNRLRKSTSAGRPSSLLSEVRPMDNLPQSPENDARSSEDYDPPWDLMKAGGGHVSRPKSGGVNGSVSVPERLSSGGGQQPPLPTSVTHDTLDTEEAKDGSSASATRPNRLNGPPSRPNLNLNLSSDSPRKGGGRTNLTLNFGCAALSAIGEKVDPQLTLEKQGWYHGSISRVDAEGKLRVLKEGSYLVRNSESSKRDYSLSLRSARGFMHMKIVPTSEGRFILGQFSNPFSSIPEMIQHYSVNKLPIKGAEHMSLLYPVIDQLL